MGDAIERDCLRCGAHISVGRSDAEQLAGTTVTCVCGREYRLARIKLLDIGHFLETGEKRHTPSLILTPIFAR